MKNLKEIKINEDEIYIAGANNISDESHQQFRLALWNLEMRRSNMLKYME